jgi:hypothetical protein
MSNERYNQIIDEAYENYTQTKIIKTDSGETHISPPGHYNGMAKEQFIDKIKIDSDFSDRWKLKITERELSLEEREKLAVGTVIFLLGSKKDSYDEAGIPTKLITLTYNNEIIESYE